MTRNITKSQVDLGLAAVSILAAVAGWFSFWTESEMWNTVVIKFLFNNPGEYNFSLKPLFNLLLFANFHAAKFLSLHPMELARVLFAVNGLLAVFLIYKITRYLGRTDSVAALVCLFCLSNSIFLKRFFNVRSDALVTTLLLGLTGFALSPYWTRLKMRSRYLIFIFISALCLCFTPKAIFLVFGWSAIFLLPSDSKRIRRIRFLRLAFLALLLGALALGPGSFRFFIESFTSSSAGLPYWSSARWEHVVRLFKENPLILLCGASGFYVWFAMRRKLQSGEKAVLGFANLCWLTLMIFPERLPFFIASLVPFYVLALPAILPILTERWKISAVTLRRCAGLIAILSLVSVSYWSALMTMRHNSTAQRMFIAWLGSKSKQLKPLMVYDPAGALPYHTLAVHWFVGPAEAGNAGTMELIDMHKPDVILGTNKLQYLGPEFDQLIEFEYWSSGDGVFTRRFLIQPEKNLIKANELKENLQNIFPYLILNRDHKVSLRVIAKGKLDLTRFLKWSQPGKNEVPFESSVSLNEIEKLGEAVAAVPPGSRLVVMPTMLEVPFGPNWITMFRFDPEF